MATASCVQETRQEKGAFWQRSKAFQQSNTSLPSSSWTSLHLETAGFNAAGCRRRLTDRWDAGTVSRRCLALRCSLAQWEGGRQWLACLSFFALHLCPVVLIVVTGCRARINKVCPRTDKVLRLSGLGRRPALTSRPGAGWMFCLCMEGTGRRQKLLSQPLYALP